MKKIILLLTICISLTLINNIEADIIMDQTNNIYVENIKYTFKQEMYFDYVGIRIDHVLFNTTSFYIDSPNNINITMEFLNQSITGGNIGDILLQFDANTTPGNVYFNISGFVTGSNYTVLQNGSVYGYYLANSTGFISFNIDDWSTTNYTIAIVLNAFIIRIFNPMPSDGGLDVKVRSGGISTCIDILYSKYGLTSAYGSNITFGNEQSFNSSISPNIVMSRQNSTHFVLLWSNATGFTGEMKVGIIDGEVITYGPEYKFNTGIVARVMVQPINDTHFIFVYRYFNVTSTKYDLNVSVGEIVAGNTINILSNRNIVQDAWAGRDGLAKINNTHYVLSFGNDKANATVIVESSGSTTNGNFYGINSLATHIFYLDARAINDSSFIMNYYDSTLIPSRDTHFVVGDVSGTVIVWGDVFNATDRIEAFVAKVDDGKVAVIYRSAIVTKLYVRVFNILNANITASNEQTIESETCSAIYMCSSIKNRFIVGYNKGFFITKPYFRAGNVVDMNITFNCNLVKYTENQSIAHYFKCFNNGHFVNAYEDTTTNNGRCIVGNLYNTLSLTFTSNATESGAWETYCDQSCITENGTYCCVNNNFSKTCDIIYYWNVTATDGNITASDSYKFTTACELVKDIKKHEVSLLSFAPLVYIPFYMFKRRKKN